jgi:hypothetical protein
MTVLLYESRADEPHSPAFERRCLELAALFGCAAKTYAELSPFYREFFEISGYARVCAMLVLKDLDAGRSQRSIAIKYGLSRDQVRFIQANAAKNRNKTRGDLSPGTV